MQQALAMRGRQKSLTVKKAKSSNSNGNSGTGPDHVGSTPRIGADKRKGNNYTTEDITNALQQLDQAEALSLKGKLEESSALYQDSLGILVAILGELKLGG
eukprot:CAMPEP_0204639206 /NCGR_PEP_ID=MMETSP0717-20131115/42143_1 /ASSEMBLY_ACC=CAM_ASM_000666 /TAXON_ID=230516 /ORGANISM="Chaetoceros curvisetus" /LENGTH=100 /DNA_ID=CAMNT_0051659225 /DNA_START=1 /DNA_END=300 /DNA_ORIENTATION=+